MLSGTLVEIATWVEESLHLFCKKSSVDGGQPDKWKTGILSLSKGRIKPHLMQANYQERSISERTKRLVASLT